MRWEDIHPKQTQDNIGMKMYFAYIEILKDIYLSMCLFYAIMVEIQYNRTVIEKTMPSITAFYI